METSTNRRTPVSAFETLLRQAGTRGNRFPSRRNHSALSDRDRMTNPANGRPRRNSRTRESRERRRNSSERRQFQGLLHSIASQTRALARAASNAQANARSSDQDSALSPSDIRPPSSPTNEPTISNNDPAATATADESDDSGYNSTSAANNTLVDLSLESVGEDLMCSICLGHPRLGQVFQCEGGHLLCGTCHARCPPQCPTCKRAVGSIRCLLAENLLSRMSDLPCVHNLEGCTHRAARDAMPGHEKACGFRPVRCPNPFCKAVKPFSKLAAHVERDHEGRAFGPRNENQPVKSHFCLSREAMGTQSYWVSDKFEVDGRVFFRECSRSADGEWRVAVFVMANREEADRYVATVKVLDARNDGYVPRMVYVGAVNSLEVEDDDKEDMGKGKAGLSFCDGVARTYKDGEKRLKYEVSIAKKEN